MYASTICSRSNSMFIFNVITAKTYKFQRKKMSKTVLFFKNSIWYEEILSIKIQYRRIKSTCNRTKGNYATQSKWNMDDFSLYPKIGK